MGEQKIPANPVQLKQIAHSNLKYWGIIFTEESLNVKAVI